MECRMKIRNQIIKNDEPVLVTGASGFIGSRVLNTLLECGFVNIRCLVQKSADADVINGIAAGYPDASVETLRGDLLRKDDCRSMCIGANKSNARPYFVQWTGCLYAWTW